MRQGAEFGTLTSAVKKDTVSKLKNVTKKLTLYLNAGPIFTIWHLCIETCLNVNKARDSKVMTMTLWEEEWEINLQSRTTR